MCCVLMINNDKLFSDLLITMQFLHLPSDVLKPVLPDD